MTHSYVKLYLVMLAIATWFALIGQLWLIVENRTLSLSATLGEYFCYFTILTNGLVAICCTANLLRKDSRIAVFFSQQQVIAAIAVYITIVGLVYNTILRFEWAPQGLQKGVDELLHTIIPILFLLYWLIWVPKNGLQWSHSIRWLLYPISYILVIAIRGAVIHSYPYSFIDVTVLGYGLVAAHTGILLVVFMLMGLMFITVGKLGSRKKQA